MPSQFSIIVISEDRALAETLGQASETSFPEATFQQFLRANEAKTYLKEVNLERISLVMLDINMQDSANELDFLAFLRSRDETQQVPVVILTVAQLPCDVVASYAFSAASFTFKPFSLNDWKTYLSNCKQTYFP
ncbi:response regulator [Spirosoma aureum]|uniref:Response regulator n=1 Tax=Spirosoma aureum TaxID=2692134 RepID=A0A6G9AS84_9BACT|nr:response regulator [Spirosoma aureum]QIP15204.1 response regulator [Spirosoma aureum]